MRKFCNIKDFSEKEIQTLKEFGFSTVAGGILIYHGDFKVPFEKLESIKEQVTILNTWTWISNSRNPVTLTISERLMTYQVKVWIRLIKRDNKHVQLKTLLGIFNCILTMRYDNDYYRKHNAQFCNRLKEIGLSEDWTDRIIRTVHR